MTRAILSLGEFESHFFKTNDFKNLKEYFIASCKASELKGFDFLWEIGPKRVERLKQQMELSRDYTYKALAACSINYEILAWCDEHGITPYCIDTYGKVRITEWSYCMGCGEPGWYVIQMCCSGSECGCMGQPVEPVICSPACYNKVIGHSEDTALPIWTLAGRTESLKYYDTAAIINEFIKLQVLKTFK